MFTHLEVGSLGEDAAARHLTARHFFILERNARLKFGEIDIIARDPKGVLVFVEVKTLNNPSMLSPEDNLTRAKFKKLARACSAYANTHPELVDESLGWRIDLSSVVINPAAPLAPEATLFSFGKNNFAIFYYENISSLFT